jgi:hypothetical protein
VKEALWTLWTYRQRAAARRFFDRWYGWARRSRLDPIKDVAATLMRHLEGVLRYCQHRITNAVAEGLNSKIMSIKRKAGGFRNPQHFAPAIYFELRRPGLVPTLNPDESVRLRFHLRDCWVCTLTSTAPLGGDTEHTDGRCVR